MPDAPIWLSLLMSVLPIPQWLKWAIPTLYALFKNIPEGLKTKIRTSIENGAVHSIENDDPIHLTSALKSSMDELHDHCSGMIGCPSDIVN